MQAHTRGQRICCTYTSSARNLYYFFPYYRNGNGDTNLLTFHITSVKMVCCHFISHFPSLRVVGFSAPIFQGRVSKITPSGESWEWVPSSDLVIY